ncbi:14592_t:CDS:2 [Entrophospora sp. SA101]|nr:3546_t:CDS:2 [Entrophospora sp. SA101]CAJ0832247.1 14592_t:CDS:2 [Entrophospora sp. SA101]
MSRPNILLLVFYAFLTFAYAQTPDVNDTNPNPDQSATTTDEGSVSCSDSGYIAEEYNLGLHIASFFIILATSSLGAFIPVISTRNPNLKMIPTAFEALSEDCLPEIWHNYAWPGAISMMAALLVFFIEYLATNYTDEFDDKNKEILPRNDDNIKGAAEVTNISQPNGTLVVLTNSSQTIGVVVLEFGICFHSVIIGMALSVASGTEFISLFCALVFHQTFEGLGLGSRIAALKLPEGSFKPWLMSLAYGATTPLGIAIGLSVRETYNPSSSTALIVQGVLDAISAGILLYAALVELLASDFIYGSQFRKYSTLQKLYAFFLLLLGAGMMALIGYWA